MVYPSLGCLICKLRRVKCDEKRPNCSQCLRYGSPCPGYPATLGGLPVKDEGSFAGGRLRRPRIPSHHKCAETSISQSSTCVSNTPGLSVVPPYIGISARGTTDTAPQYALSPSLEDQALNYFFSKFCHDSSILLDSHNAFYPTLLRSSTSVCRETLLFGLQAVSLLAFTNIRGISGGVTSREYYGNALSKFNQQLKHPELAISDELLAATMLLASYEHMSTSALDENIVLTRFWAHHKGATTLLALRRCHASKSLLSIRLEKSVRQQIIRWCIMHGFPLAHFLHDGSLYGESGIDLDFDQSFVSLATVRQRTRALRLTMHVQCGKRHHLPDTNILEDCITEVTSIQKETNSIDVDLGNLAKTVMTNSGVFSTSPVPTLPISGRRDHLQDDGTTLDTQDLFYGSCYHTYTDMPIAMRWNSYRAARLTCRIITASLSRYLGTLYTFANLFPISDKDTSTLLAHNLKMEETQALVNDICQSVYYHLSSHTLPGKIPHRTERNAQIPMTTIAPELTVRLDSPYTAGTITSVQTMLEVKPSRAYSLVFPLTVSLAVPGIDESQRRWIRQILAYVARTTGNRAVGMAAADNITKGMYWLKRSSPLAEQDT